jgi:glycosyltransferase involved in cell wall biosynthesis
MTMRILILSYFFPPYNTIGAVRVGKTAKHLINIGHDLRVVTATNQTLNHKELIPSLPIEIPQDKIFTTGASNANLRSFLPTETINKRHLLWLPYALIKTSKVIQDWKPDILFASGLPTVSLIAASIISRIFRLPWVAELRDLWSDNPYLNFTPWRRRLEEYLEKWSLSSASGIVTVSEPLANILSTKYQIPVKVILNGFDPEDIPPRGHKFRSNGKLQILYTGSVYEGKRDPTPLFQALHKLDPLSSAVRVDFYGPNLDIVNDLAYQCQVDHIVKTHDPVSRQDALELQVNADILLLLIWDGPKTTGTYTGKLFEYLGTRRPILVIGNPENVAAQLIISKEAGFASLEPEKIASQLKVWIEGKKHDNLPSLSSDIIRDYTRLEQTKVLEQFLIRLCWDY